MEIRKALPKDIPGLHRLLSQVLEIHHQGRPDLFKTGVRKYTDEELAHLLQDENRPIFAAIDESGQVLGYAFCIFQQYKDDNIFTPVKTLYIDDLCVDEACRGQHLGRQLYDHVLAFARAQGCYNVTLNVWAFNESALRFYESCGLKPQKTGMETIL
ncbi:MAG: GNAT family N-acetyltransferase [Oscillospiraceae bacterium]|jgi:ribosomal protein S18 acetylase RimI-like enzyme|nr:GNAT family N-acetyltransferase [Oscillospiraceae bacterium]